MITHLSGKLVEKTPTHIVVECSGVGYLVKISLNTFSALGKDENIKILTQFIVREDAQILYGFLKNSERDMFNHLISVSGIGPNTAILMLSSMSSDEIAQAIISENVDAIKSIKGIGLKTAQRVIVDLKSKMGQGDISSENIFSSNNTNRFEALTALSALGFDKKKAEMAINKVMTDEQTVEELIKASLKIL